MADRLTWGSRRADSLNEGDRFITQDGRTEVTVYWRVTEFHNGKWRTEIHSLSSLQPYVYNADTILMTYSTEKGTN